jgi:hypothetical protein
MKFQEQAESCRRQATQYAGKPEAPFLLRIARAFDELASSGSRGVIAHMETRDVTVSRENIPA